MVNDIQIAGIINSLESIAESLEELTEIIKSEKLYVRGDFHTSEN